MKSSQKQPDPRKYGVGLKWANIDSQNYLTTAVVASKKSTFSNTENYFPYVLGSGETKQ